MKYVFNCLIALLIFTFGQAQVSKWQSEQLLKFYSEKNFFKLDKLMSGIKVREDDPDLLLYKATIDNVFNKPDESNHSIDIILKKYSAHFNDAIMKELYFMRSANAYRLQDYKTAYLDDSVIVARYSHVCDFSEIDSREDDITIFRSIMNAPKMGVSLPADARASFKRDIADLYNVSITLEKDTVDFVFDTGANFSVIMESLANRYGVKIVGSRVRTGTSAGLKVEGQMGLMNFRMGNIEVENAAVIVLADSLLTFSNGAYRIKGIVGFPVMYAFKEFSIKDDDCLTVPQKPEAGSERNLALYGQYLVVRVIAKSDTLPFLFDSGNTTTELGSLFFNNYRNEIEGKCAKVKTSTGGAGGAVESEAYVLDSLDISAGISRYTLHSMMVHPIDQLGYDMKYFYGNFGQDYIDKFSEMKINFASMDISFLGLKKK